MDSVRAFVAWVRRLTYADRVDVVVIIAVTSLMLVAAAAGLQPE